MPLRPLQRDLFGRPGARTPARTHALVASPGLRVARALRRRWPVATLVLCLSVGAAAAALACLQPVYQAGEELETQDVPPAVTFAGAAPAADNTAPDGVQSLAEELGARELVAEAVNQLPPEQQSALALRWLRQPRWMKTAFARWLPARPPAAAAMRQLQVAAVTGSRVIRLQFLANQPVLASGFLSALTQVALRRSATRQQQAGALRVAIVAQQAQNAQLQVQEAEAQLEALAAGGGLPDPAGRLAQATQLWQQLATAQATATVTAAQRSAALMVGALPATPAVPDGGAPAPADLELRRAEQAAEVTRLAAIYRPGAAPLVEARRELASLDASLAAIRQQHMDALRRSLAAAQQEQANLRQAMRREATAQPNLRAQAAAFELAQRDLVARQNAYSALLQQLAQSAAVADEVQPPLRVMDAARTAPHPLRPRPAPTVAEAVLLGCLLSVAMLWGLERWDDRLRLPEAAEMGVPLAAVLPRLTPSRTAVTPAAPSRAFLRGLETVVAALLQARSEIGAGVVLITSAEAGVGKTSLALALAQRLAVVAPEVLLLDANADASALQRELGGESAPGLADLLAGRCRVEDALRSAGEPEAHLAWIAAGRTDEHGPLAALASGEAAALLDAASARHAWVIVDGPPVSAGPEAGLWSALADYTLLAAAYGRCSRRRVRHSLDALEQAGAAGLALVLCDARERDAVGVDAVRLLPGRRAEDVVAMRQRA